MKSDEIEARARLSGDEVSLMGAMIEKSAQEFRSLRRCRAGGIRATDASVGEGSQNGICRVVVQLQEFLASALPISDIGLVPHFPQPGFRFRGAVALAKMTDKLKDKFGPFLIILGRVGPAGENRALRKTVAVRLRMSRERLGHESDFDERVDSSGGEGIENTFQNLAIVEGLVRRVLRGNSCCAPVPCVRALAWM